LTRAELRVAELVAQGHTSRQIAEQLFVSPRTVDAHLTHIFRKLDIGSRAKLAALMAEIG
jgi:DNA-binding CsgD family transcriptional regulator